MHTFNKQKDTTYTVLFQALGLLAAASLLGLLHARLERRRAISEDCLDPLRPQAVGAAVVLGVLERRREA